MFTPTADCNWLENDCCVAALSEAAAAALALSADCDAVMSVAKPARVAGAVNGADSVPDAPRPVVFAAGCGTPACTSGPSAKFSTRSIMPVKPARPLGLGVNALAP